VGLSWETASELDNLGFHLYRAASGNGPWTRITPFLIPGLGSSPEGKRYSFVDAGLVNGATYFYRLEDVDRSGETTSHGPVSAVPQAGTGRATSPPPAQAPGPRSGETSPTEWKAYGDPSKASFRVLSRTSSSVTVQLDTGGFYALAQPDGSFRLFVPGFFELSEPGLPSLPARRAWLDAVVGRGVRLGSVAPYDLVSYPRLRVVVAGAPQAVVEGGNYKASFRPVRPQPLVQGLYPRSSAQILQTAFQGETKRVYLELMPLRVDAATGQLVLARRLVVRLLFQGRVPGEQSRGGSWGRRMPPSRRPGNAGLVLARLSTRTRGLHALAFEELFPTERRSLPIAYLRLSHLGQAVAFHVEPRSNAFGPGSRLFFFGEGTESAYAGEAVYELAWGSGGLRMAQGMSRSAPSAGSLPSLVSLRHEQKWEQNANYLPALLEARDLWMSDYGIGAVQGQDYPFTLASLALVPETAHLKVDLQGGSDTDTSPDHHVRVFLNGSFVAEGRFDGMKPFSLEADVPVSTLLEGANTLRIENAGDTGAPYSFVYLDRFSLEYPHSLTLEAGVLEGRASVSGLVTVAGTSPGTVVLDLAGPRWMGEVQTGDLVFPAEAGHRYLVVSPQAVLRPERREVLPSMLRSSDNQADWILIAHRAFLDPVQPLVAQRQAQGLSTIAVALEDVYGEFGFGETSPQAIRDFIAFAFHRWSPPSPRYVLLLGDSTYDPKGFLKPQTTLEDRLPSPLVKSSFLWTASDPLYASVNGEDLIPDLAIGRITAQSPEEVQDAVAKILDFENAALTLDGKAVLVADVPDQAGNFEQDVNEIASLLPGRDVRRLFFAQLGAATQPAVIAAFDSGVSLLSFVGHGSAGVWGRGGGVLRVTDVPSLQPQPVQPFVLTMTCSNGYFLSPWMNSLTEGLLLAPQEGAIAAFSPTGLSLNDAAHLYHKAVVQQLQTGHHARIGDLVLAAQSDYAQTGAFPELLSIYHLFGDPALKIR
jgi:hypothetical protein